MNWWSDSEFEQAPESWWSVGLGLVLLALIGWGLVIIFGVFS
jgi:hypothetical protein